MKALDMARLAVTAPVSETTQKQVNIVQELCAMAAFDGKFEVEVNWLSREAIDVLIDDEYVVRYTMTGKVNISWQQHRDLARGKNRAMFWSDFFR